MGTATGIQWTDKTWNPWRGCTKISPGCAHCYMFMDQRRFGKDPESVVLTKTWGDPVKWNRQAQCDCNPHRDCDWCRGGCKTPMVFTCSWSDWFHEAADDWRENAWRVVKACPNLIFQILTKRSERIADCLPDDWGDGYPNVWLGVSIETQKYIDRVEHLRAIPAVCRFVSAEPLLNKLTFQAGQLKCMDCDTGTYDRLPDPCPGRCGIDWMIIGGESGGGARPCRIDWIRSLVRDCREAGVAPFVKQVGSHVLDRNDRLSGDDPNEWPEITAVEHGQDIYQGADVRIRLNDNKGGDMLEWPKDIRVREFPKVTVQQ